MKKTIIVALLALTGGFSACSTSYRSQNLRSSHHSYMFTVNDTVQVKSIFEQPTYFLVVSPADQRGRYGVYDLTTGEYTLLSSNGMLKLTK